MHNGKKLEEILLLQGYGAATKLAKTMGVLPVAVAHATQRGIIRENTKKRYTIAINHTFGTNYTVADIFGNKE